MTVDRISQKPACLPISSVAEMDAFETIDDNDFRQVVSKQIYKLCRLYKMYINVIFLILCLGELF